MENKIILYYDPFTNLRILTSYNKAITTIYNDQITLAYPLSQFKDLIKYYEENNQ
jgi:hypothetical protein